MSAKRILVVDDDRTTVLLLTRLLQKAGYATASAFDAAQGVTQAHRELPALIVTDMMMPAGGGLSVLERLGLSSRTSTIPIIVVTASEEPEVEARALGAGAVRVIRKPVDPGQFLDAVKDAIGDPGNVA